MRLSRTPLCQRFVVSILSSVVVLALFLSPGGDRSAGSAALVIRDADDVLYLHFGGALHSTDGVSLAALGLDHRRARYIPRRSPGALPEGEPLPPLQNGSIVAAPDGARYLVLHGLHAIPDEATFDAYGWAGGAGFAARPIVQVPAGLLSVAVVGPPLERAAHAGDQRRFDWGYCTWWVARRRAVPWSGNAVEWFANAQAMGYATGDQPLPGAILVRRSATWAGFGHVAYVESVEGTTFTVSEMNVNYVGELTTTTYDLATKPPPGLLGFVYWRYGPMPHPTERPAERPAEPPAGRDRGQGQLAE